MHAPEYVFRALISEMPECLIEPVGPRGEITGAIL